MHVQYVEIDDFQCKTLKTYFGRKFITISDHLICLKHVCRDAEHHEGFELIF